MPHSGHWIGGKVTSGERRLSAGGIAPTGGIVAAALLWSIAVACAQPCGTVSLGESKVTAIEDSHTLALADGRKIRLAGIEWTVPAEAARALLADLVLNRQVTLKAPENTEPDRYGRIYAFPSVSGSETPIQYGLLGRGKVLVSGRVSDKACADALRTFEKQARDQGLGAFSAGASGAHKADHYGAILNDLGRFAVVEGKVLSVREAGNLIYVNFGRRWSEDFTVTIAKRHQAAFISAGVAPKSLSGQTLRVRGFIEERAGPWIEAVDPAQFETVASR
jgi:hypothetical protein